MKARGCHLKISLKYIPLTLELTGSDKLASKQTLRDPAASPVLGTSEHYPTQLFDIGTRGSNLDLHGCVADALLTESTFQPIVGIIS